MERTPLEIQEIERHKYFLSERAGYDVGWDFAAQDWDDHHAAQWRSEREGVGDGEDTNHQASAVEHQTSTATLERPTSSPPASTASPASNGSRPYQRHDGPCERKGPLLKLFEKFFGSSR